MAKAVPSSRIGRLARTGHALAGVAASALGNAARQAASGQRPDLRNLILTPGNAHRIAEHLRDLRGAAMKVGQLLSLDDGNVLPTEFSAALAVLREDAKPMPLLHVARILESNWGQDWDQAFESFEFTPMAAASIGQVHRARLKSGEEVAIKIQYPGVRDSIDSDVDNVSTFLRLSRILPENMDLTPLLQEAKSQLHDEADYLREAAHIQLYAAKLGETACFGLPIPFMDRTSQDVLTMHFLSGIPIEKTPGNDVAERRRVAEKLIELTLNEIFRWGLVQTDPNFANYRYEPTQRRIQLLDFGATRSYPAEQVNALCDLLQAALADDASALESAAEQVGYLSAESAPAYRNDVVTLLRLAAEPLRRDEPFDFASTDLADRMRNHLIGMRSKQRHAEVPPTGILFLHRKIGGLFLLLSHLRTAVNVHRLVKRALDERAPEGAS